MRLAGRTCVVTGGARGIGRAIAERLLADGATGVVVADRDADAAERAADELGERAWAHTLDVGRSADVHGLVDAVLTRADTLDVWVNNAAHARYDFAVDLAEEDWDYTIGIALKGYFLGSQAAARQMLRQGHGKIVNVSSIAAVVGLARTAAYAASKGGVDALTRVMAIELARDNIQVNAVAPGPVYTDFSREVVTEEGFRRREERIPIGRMGQPADVAGVVALLAGPDSDWITGEVVRVDGGYSVLGAMEPRAG